MQIIKFWAGVAALAVTLLSHAEVKELTCLSFTNPGNPDPLERSTGLLEGGANRKDVFIFDTSDFAKTRGELTHTKTFHYERSPEFRAEYPTQDWKIQNEYSTVAKFTATPTHLIVQEEYGSIKINRTSLMVDMVGGWHNPKPCKIEDAAVQESNVF